MKSLKMSFLMLAVGAVLTCSVPGHAQQEVDPDHFDQPSVVPHVQRSRKQSPRLPAARQYQANSKLASPHSDKKHHRQHARLISDSRDTLGR